MQNQAISIKMIDIVEGTSTNSDGLAIFIAVENHIQKGEKVKLSLLGATPLSTSFLNSFLGNLLDKYGIEKIRAFLIFSQLTPSQSRKLSSYFEQIGVV